MVLSWNSHDIFCLLCSLHIMSMSYLLSRCSAARAHVWFFCYNPKCLVQWFVHRRHFKNVCGVDKWTYKSTNRFANVGILHLPPPYLFFPMSIYPILVNGRIHYPFAQTKTWSSFLFLLHPTFYPSASYDSALLSTSITFQWPLTVSNTTNQRGQRSANYGPVGQSQPVAYFCK